MQTNTIAVTTYNGHFIFNAQKIVCLQACSNYTNIYFINKKKLLTSKVLKEFASVLEPLGFIRIHRTHFVKK